MRLDRRPRDIPTESGIRPRGSRLGEVSCMLTVLRALCRYPHTLSRLADLTGKHPRTVRRYLDALEELRVPFQSDLRRTGHRWVRVWWTRPGAVWAWLVTEPADNGLGGTRPDARRGEAMSPGPRWGERAG